MQKVVILSLFIVSIACSQVHEAYQSDCFKKKKMDIVFRLKDSKSYVYTNNELWSLKSVDDNIIDSKSKWYFKNYEGKLNDIEMLKVLEMYDLAEKVKLDYDRDKSRIKTKFFVGLPVGITMMGGAAYLTNEILKEDTPEVWEVAIDAILGFGGLGLIWGVTSQFVHRNDDDMYKHKLTFKQSMEFLDRYNTSLVEKCKNSEQR